MTQGIIVGVLSLIGTLAGTYFANRKSSALSLTAWNFLKRKSTNTIPSWKGPSNWKNRRPFLKKKIKVANHRIEDLENK